MTTVTAGSSPRHDRTGRGVGAPTPTVKPIALRQRRFGDMVWGQDAGNADVPPDPNDYAGVMSAAS